MERQPEPVHAIPGTMPIESQRAAAVRAANAPPLTGVDAPAPIWLQRASLAVLVVFCLYLGGLLVYLPWWREMWDHNSLLVALPTLHHYLIQGPVRGLVSGIGLLDLWIGVSEIVHYREYRA